jgi:hypothetical protein
MDGNIPSVGQSLPLVHANLGDIEGINLETLPRQPNAVATFAICHAQHPFTGLPIVSLPAKVVIGLGSKQIGFSLETSVPRLRCMHMTRTSHLPPDALREATLRRLDHYNHNAEDFFAGTRDHDVQQNMDALLQFIEGLAPFNILDFGCGPGRDLKAFSERGHLAVGLEGATRFVEMARSYSGCTVWHQDFLALLLPHDHFDGVFANASLLNKFMQIQIEMGGMPQSKRK